MSRTVKPKDQFYRFMIVGIVFFTVSDLSSHANLAYAGPGILQLVSKGDFWIAQEKAERSYQARLAKIRKNKNFEKTSVWADLFGSLKLEDLSNRNLKILETLRDLKEFEATATWALTRIHPVPCQISSCGPIPPTSTDHFFRLLGIAHEIKNQMRHKNGDDSPSLDDLDRLYQGLNEEARQVLRAARERPIKRSEELHLACLSTFLNQPEQARQCSQILTQAATMTLHWKADSDDLIHHSLKHPLQTHELKGHFSDSELKSWLNLQGPLAYEASAKELLFEFSQSETPEAQIGFEPPRPSANHQLGMYSFCLPFTTEVKKADEVTKKVQRFKKALVMVTEVDHEILGQITTFIPRMYECELPRPQSASNPLNQLLPFRFSHFLKIYRSRVFQYPALSSQTWSSAAIDENSILLP